MDLRRVEPLVPHIVWTRDVMLAHGATDNAPNGYAWRAVVRLTILSRTEVKAAEC